MKKRVLALLVFGTFAFSQTLQVGQMLAIKSLPNQFEKEVTISQDTKKLIIAFSKEQGNRVKAFLDKNHDYLAQNRARYLVDISGAPGFVTSMFMLPKFRKYHFPMLLIEDEKDASYFPQKEDKLTIITLKKGKVIDIKFLQKL